MNQKEKYRILCFGDSLTWGYDPDNKIRFPKDARWPGVLEQCLGEGYTIIEEGQPGRTVAVDDPAEGEKNGLKYIRPCLESHTPFNLLIIMMGVNDLKTKFGFCAMDVAGEMQIFLEKVKSYIHFRMNDKADILLISPPHLGEGLQNSWLGPCFEVPGAIKRSKELADWYRQLSEMYGTYFLDAADVVKASPSDSVHLNKENQILLGKTIADYIVKTIDLR